MSEQITVIARFKTKPETAAQVREIAAELVRQTRTEDGCLNYDFYADLADETVFWMSENWVGQNALDEHFKQPHTRTALHAIKDLLAEPVEIRRLKMISPKA